MSEITRNINMRTTGSLEDVLADYFRTTVDNINYVAVNKANTSVIEIFADNIDAIFDMYGKTEKEDNSQIGSIDLVKAGTWIRIPLTLHDEAAADHKAKVRQEVASYVTSSVDNLVSASVQEIMRSVLGQERYKALPHADGTLNETLETEPMIRVLVLSRSTSSKGSPKLVNITPFIFNGNTHVDSNGGNFSLSLDPVTVVNQVRGYWSVSDMTSNISTYGGAVSEEYLSDSATHRQEVSLHTERIKPSEVIDPLDNKGVNAANKVRPNIGQRSYRNEMLLNMIISPQDMVFIKFGLLESEVAAGFSPDGLLKPLGEISLSQIRNENFDMIGLVDKVGESGAVGNASMSVEVGGRDLMKLLIEDGTYVFPIVTGQGSEKYQSNYFANISEEEKAKLDDNIYQRVFGEIQDITLFVKEPVKVLLGFIYKKLNTIDVFPDSAFQGYFHDDPKARGIWKMTELTVDDNIGERVLADSSLRTNSGSLLSFFQSVCQEPFVEFFGDTYGSKYHFIARKPPFEEKDIENVWEATGRLTISDNEVYDFNLDMDDSDVYTWYRLIPEAFMFGDSNMAMYYFPAIFLKEYAEIWGSKKREFTSRFLDYGGSVKSAYQQSLNDLQYILSINLLLPFTRKGKVTLKGQRRVKRGTWIYFEGSDEICYVNSVSHSYSISNQKINGETTLQVSRCMKLRHLSKYFQLMQFPESTDPEKRNVSWRVNKAVFDFFIRKRQFIA